jgi:hypothetical protein
MGNNIRELTDADFLAIGKNLIQKGIIITVEGGLVTNTFVCGEFDQIKSVPVRTIDYDTDGSGNIRVVPQEPDGETKLGLVTDTGAYFVDAKRMDVLLSDFMPQD